MRLRVPDNLWQFSKYTFTSADSHKTSVMASGRLWFHDHSKQDILNQINLAKLGGDPCHCAKLLLVIRGEGHGWCDGYEQVRRLFEELKLCAKTTRVLKQYMRRYEDAPLPAIHFQGDYYPPVVYLCQKVRQKGFHVSVNERLDATRNHQGLTFIPASQSPEFRQDYEVYCSYSVKREANGTYTICDRQSKIIENCPETKIPFDALTYRICWQMISQMIDMSEIDNSKKVEFKNSNSDTKVLASYNPDQLLLSLQVGPDQKSLTPEMAKIVIRQVQRTVDYFDRKTKHG